MTARHGAPLKVEEGLHTEYTLNVCAVIPCLDLESIPREARLDSVQLGSEMYCIVYVVVVHDNCTRSSRQYLLLPASA